MSERAKDAIPISHPIRVTGIEVCSSSDIERLLQLARIGGPTLDS